MSQVSVAVRRSAVLGLLPPDLAAPQLARGPMLRAHEVAGNSEVLASLTGRGSLEGREVRGRRDQAADPRTAVL